VAQLSSARLITFLLLAMLAGQAAAARSRCSPAAASRSPGAAARTRAGAPAAKPDRIAGGAHWRLRTSQGAVHVWRPDGYRRERAGLVVYVHGHNLQVDQAWERFKLAEQFRASNQNALFVVPEAPSNSEQHVQWPSLNELAREVVRQIRQPLPAGHWVAIGHSGGFRTLAAWLENPRLDHLVLLDALYANEPEFEAWLAEGPRAASHRMVLVGADTRGRCDAFLRRLPRGKRHQGIPELPSDLSRRERGAPVLYLVSQYNHNQMVQNGKVIPLLLRLSRLRALSTQ
jgi:hypothetical protein